MASLQQLLSLTLLLLLFFSSQVKAQFTDFSFVDGTVNGACRSALSFSDNIRLIRPETTNQEIIEYIITRTEAGVGRCTIAESDLGFGFDVAIKNIFINRYFSPGVGTLSVENTLGSITLNNNSGVAQSITVFAYAAAFFENGEHTSSLVLNLPTGVHTLPVNLVGSGFRIELATPSNQIFLRGYSATTNVPVNGQCGTANNIATLTAPTTNLCAVGNTSSVLSNAGNFSWSCEGSFSGTTANCSAPRQYSVNFNLGDGSRTGGGELSQTVNYGAAAIAPTVLPPTGYSLIGWSSNFSNVTSQLSISAQYMLNSYTLSFNSAGGSNVTAINASFGTTITAPTPPTREGYTFTGWSPALPTTMPAQNTTVTAQWQVNSYTLSFNSAGGSTVAGINADFGTAITAPTPPTREGYTYTGWSPALPATMPAQNTTFTAQWQVNSYTLSFNSAGGSAVASINADFGTAITAPAPPTREGYTFTGWNPALPTTMPATNSTVTAQWQINTYTVIFNLDGGILTPGETLTRQVEFNQAVTAPAFVPPIGKAFAGWSAPLTNISSDITITALYEDLIYQVTFDLGEYGQRSGGGELTQQIIFDQNAIEPIFSVQSGWKFSRWSSPLTYIRANGTISAIFEPDDSLTVVTITTSAGGTANIDQQQVQTGQRLQVILTPETGFKTDRLILGSCPTGSWLSDNVYESAAISSSCTINFKFSETKKRRTKLWLPIVANEQR